jgi:bla regulator protein BlaR1
MNLIRGILSEKVINALGWTIIHSLWQGLLIGSMLFLLLFLFRKQNASFRYNLSVFSLAFIMGFSVLTFSLYSRGQNQSVSLSGNLTVSVPFEGKFSSAESSGNNVFRMIFNPITRSISDDLSLRFPLITGIWLLGVFIISLRMAGGLFYLRKLRNSGLIRLPEYILSKFENLTFLMKIQRKPKFYKSVLIKVPSVIGYIRPMILLPVSALTYIPVEQLEAIVAHELAHIRRHDWLVNIFQSVMGALYFYHPAVWYIQSVIRKERENCCDDIALKYSGGQLVYIKALASINEIQTSAGYPLLAINSGRNHLLNRVLRILKKGKMKTNFKDKLFAGLLLITATAIILLNTGGQFISINSMNGNQPDTSISILPDIETNIAVVTNPVPVTLPVIQTIVEPAIEINVPEKVNPVVVPSVVNPLKDTTLRIKDNVVQRTIYRNGKEMDMKLRIENGEPTELTINGELIPEKDWGKYQAEIDETIAEVKELEEDLTEANEKLAQMDMEKFRVEIEHSIQEATEKIKEIDVEAIVQKLENIEPPEIDEEKLKQEIEQAMKEIQNIDTEKIRAEMEHAMQSVCEEIEKIELPDPEQLKQELEKARQELEQIDQEKIKYEIQQAMKEVQINREELKREIERSLEEIKEADIENFDKQLDIEKMKMDEMLKEIEKLELEKK